MKVILKWKPYGKRLLSRPNERWLDKVKKYLDQKNNMDWNMKWRDIRIRQGQMKVGLCCGPQQPLKTE